MGTKEIGILKADTEAHAKGFSGDKNVEGKHKREKKHSITSPFRQAKAWPPVPLYRLNTTHSQGDTLKVQSLQMASPEGMQYLAGEA